MGDGWETRRSREPGHSDWVVIKLGAKGIINKVVVDTAHFKGNFPQQVKLEATESDEVSCLYERLILVRAIPKLDGDLVATKVRGA